MTAETLEFCQEGAPFAVRMHPVNNNWTVRDNRGGDVANCEDEDAAEAIADALNCTLEKKT